MAVSALVSLEEYLRTSYDPDVEYIDGELREKNAVVQWVHGNLQFLLSVWFGQHRREWKITGGVESRIQVNPERVRLPDVIVDHAGHHPAVLTAPPLVVIEILSPSDTFAETVEKVQDYLAMGIPNVWIIDPPTRTGFVCNAHAQPRPTLRFEVANSPIYLDLTLLFAEADEDNRA
jgi:Uma2 family endonuclease